MGQLIEKIMVNMNLKISRGFEKNVSIVCSSDNEDYVTLEVSFEQDTIGLYSNHPETSVKYFVTNL